MPGEQASELLKDIKIDFKREPGEEEAIKNLDAKVKEMSCDELDQVIDVIGKTELSNDPNRRLDTLSDAMGDFENKIQKTLDYKAGLEKPISDGEEMKIVSDLVQKLAIGKGFKDEIDKLNEELGNLRYPFSLPEHPGRGYSYEELPEEKKNDPVIKKQHEVHEIRRAQIKQLLEQKTSELEATKAGKLPNDKIMLLQVYLNAINERQGKQPISPKGMTGDALQSKRLEVNGIFGVHTLNALLLASGWEFAAKDLYLDFGAGSQGLRAPGTKRIVRHGMKYVPIDISKKYKEQNAASPYDGIRADLTSPETLAVIKEKLDNKKADKIYAQHLFCYFMDEEDDEKKTYTINIDSIQKILALASQLLKPGAEADFIGGHHVDLHQGLDMKDGLLTYSVYVAGEGRKIYACTGSVCDEIVKTVKFDEKGKISDPAEKKKLYDIILQRFLATADHISKTYGVKCEYTGKGQRGSPTPEFKITMPLTSEQSKGIAKKPQSKSTHQGHPTQQLVRKK